VKQVILIAAAVVITAACIKGPEMAAGELKKLINGLPLSKRAALAVKIMRGKL